MLTNTTPVKASTQEHLPIEDIKDDVIILKDGSCCQIIQVTAINFQLLSEKEQKAMIFAYASLLNSLSFPIQVSISSKKKDISAYFKRLDSQEKKITRPHLKKQLQRYKKFIEETVKKNEVLDKQFYVVIPFSILELGAAQTAASMIKKKRVLPYPQEYIVDRAKTNLAPKIEHLTKQFNRLGIKSRLLKSKELVNLFFTIYNPEEKQDLPEVEEMTQPIMEGKI
jgi:type IV secretory pathway VirB4 component